MGCAPMRQAILSSTSSEFTTGPLIRQIRWFRKRVHHPRSFWTARTPGKYFHDSGVQFLNTLFSKLEQLRPDIEFITLSDALDDIRESPGTPSIPNGILDRGTFHIWIGHPEDHAAWEMLSTAHAPSWISKTRIYEREGKTASPTCKRHESTLWSPKDPTGAGGTVTIIHAHGPEFDRLSVTI